MNLVIITSFINANTNLSVYSNDERIDQLVGRTLPSIVDKIPDHYIVLLEGSNLTKEQILKISHPPIREIFYIESSSVNKSVGETNLITTYLNTTHFIEKEKNIENIVKISGRYKLLDNFNFSENITENVIKKDCTRKVCETRYYKVNKKYITHYKNCMNALQADGIFYDVEHSFYENNIVPCNFYIEKLHVGGNIAPDGNYIED
jgi:hypothetical protein